MTPRVNCPSGKRTYMSKTDAKRALAAVQTMVKGPTAVQPYRCRKCKRWHLTKSRRRDSGRGPG